MTKKIKTYGRKEIGKRVHVRLGEAMNLFMIWDCWTAISQKMYDSLKESKPIIIPNFGNIYVKVQNNKKTVLFKSDIEFKKLVNTYFTLQQQKEENDKENK